MGSIPAICDNCGLAFPSGMAVAGNVRNLTLSGNRAGPCPACGATGTIPDGLFNAVDGVVEAVSSPHGEAALSDLIGLLKAWQREPPSPDDVLRTLQTEAPQLAPFFGRFTPKSPSALAAWIAVILAVLQLIQGCQQRNVEVDQTQIDELTLNVIEQEAEKR